MIIYLTVNCSKISFVRVLVSKQIRKFDEHILQIMFVNEETYGNYSCVLTETTGEKTCGIETIYTDKLTTRMTHK